VTRAKQNPAVLEEMAVLLKRERRRPRQIAPDDWAVVTPDASRIASTDNVQGGRGKNEVGWGCFFVGGITPKWGHVNLGTVKKITRPQSKGGATRKLKGEWNREDQGRKKLFRLRAIN